LKKKNIIDLGVSAILLIMSLVVLLLPSFNINNLKIILIIIFGTYALVKLIQFILIYKEKDYESLFTFLISIGALAIVIYLELSVKNIALMILIWMGLMCLVKLKKADFYHDRENKIWILRLIMLFIFLTSGLITGLNLKLEETRIIVIGYFFFINSALDILEPIVIYIGEK